MIRGRLNERLEATVVVEVSNGDGDSQTVEAVLDTGFNGYLTLTGELIERLGLDYLGQIQTVLADGGEITAYTYEAFVNWLGQTRRAEIIASEGVSILGMSLLAGCKITMRVRVGGEALIEPDDEA